MPPAARLGDPSGHPGAISGPCMITVLIAGKPAARAGDMHTCSIPPHPTSPIVPPASKTVLIGGKPAARVGDRAACGAPIVAGAPTVVIGG